MQSAPIIFAVSQRIPPTFLIISQVYVPDPASVGQHVADAAAAMVQRGYRVIVYASARGYDDPSRKYPSRETLNGVDVRRLPLSSFGKKSIAVRLLAQWSFLIQAIFHGLFTRRLCGIMVSTSPPFCGFAGALLSRLRRVPVKYWLMDLNPDQMIAMKIIRERSLPARVFDLFNRMILRRASDIVMLDRFMLDRVKRKGVPVEHKTAVMPPWPHEDELQRIPHAENPFRAKHALPPGERFVVMYSGNHSPANPLKTLLDAAEQLQNEPRLVFYCIGGGGGKKEVDDRIAAGATNIVSLPYQPLSEIKYSLSAADVHVVSIGNEVVGIVHPCKVYGAMAVSRPILLLGPSPSHVSDLIEQHRIGWHVAHGDTAGAVRVLREMLATPPEQLAQMGERAAAVISTTLSKATLCGSFCDVLCRGLPRP
ncbi:MAG: glycosyltransferase family 4 protein [Phycisphaerales bacterium]